MSNTYTNLVYHCIWSTKNREPLLKSPINTKVYKSISDIVYNEGGNVINIGGMPDHVHLLISIKPSESIARIIRCVKSGSSKVMRQSYPFLHCFSWQRGYGAFTVSLSQQESVHKYIDNQCTHHRTRTFEEEYVAILRKNEISYDNRYLFG